MERSRSSSSRRVCRRYFGLEPFFLSGVGIFCRLFDMELLDIAGTLRLSQGDQDVPAISFLIFVGDHTWRALVTGQNIAVTPGIIFHGNDIVFEGISHAAVS